MMMSSPVSSCRAPCLAWRASASRVAATAYENDQEAAAAQLFIWAAGLGDAGGMSNLGALLAGRGETEQAEKLYHQAAGLGNADAMFNLGILLEDQGETELGHAGDL